MVSERGASLRALAVRGIELVRGTFDEHPPLNAGVVLVPWPNRVEEGRWSLDGSVQQLALTEPELGNANHGLLADARYDPVGGAGSSVGLQASVRESAGYPFALDTRVDYELVESGILVSHTIVNRSDRAAPVALGAHPYLRLGDVPVDELELVIPADLALELDERHIPRGSIDVSGTPYDLRGGRLVRDAVPHACYGVLPEGGSAHRLTDPVSGVAVELWTDPAFGYVQVFVTREFPDAPLAIAIEPMTAPPNALRTGTALRWLEAGCSWSVRWGIRLLD